MYNSKNATDLYIRSKPKAGKHLAQAKSSQKAFLSGP